MKWVAYNALGGCAWLAGLSVAKMAAFPSGNPVFSSNHQLAVGFLICAMALVVLLWTNLGTSDEV